MTLAQQAAMQQLAHFELVALCTDSKHLIVRGATGLYWLSPGGLLTPIKGDPR